MDFLEFSPQCCDADAYAGRGYQCALGFSGCYSPIRPMGIVLWYSLHYRVGLPLVSYLYINLLLLLFSSVLLGVAFSRLLPRRLRVEQPAIGAIAPSLSSLTAHLVFFWPTMFNTLSDTPAGLWALLGIGALLNLGAKTEFYYVLLAALALGFAAWMRAFYLYPLYGALAVFLILWLKPQNREYRSLLVLLALSPVAVQHWVTYSRTGEASYLDHRKEADWATRHLTSKAKGYDTLLYGTPPPKSVPLEAILAKKGHYGEAPNHPQFDNRIRVNAYYWPSNCSSKELGLLDAWRKGEIKVAACLVFARLDFYLRSYSPRSYLLGGLGSRKFSVWFLLANGFAFIACCWLLVDSLRSCRPGMWAATTFLATSAAEAIVIIPEQRFFAVPQVVIWTACLVSVTAFVLRRAVERRKAVPPDWPEAAGSAPADSEATSGGTSRG